MVTQQEIAYELRQRRKEEEKEFLRMLCDQSPEGKKRLEEYLQQEEQERENHKREIVQTANNLLNEKVLQRMGDYRELYFYRKSKVIYDLTFHFCDRFITEYHDRTKDQMIQAARSGKQNFVEGLQDGQADFEKALYLISIGQGSLQELLEDYEDYLRTRKLQIWTAQHHRYTKLVEYCKKNNDIDKYLPLFEKMNDEELANMALTLIHQTDFLIEGFLKRIEKVYIEIGGTRQRVQQIRKAKEITRKY